MSRNVAICELQLRMTEKHRLGKNFDPTVGKNPECFTSKQIQQQQGEFERELVNNLFHPRISDIGCIPRTCLHYRVQQAHISELKLKMNSGASAC